MLLQLLLIARAKDHYFAEAWVRKGCERLKILKKRKNMREVEKTFDTF